MALDPNFIVSIDLQEYLVSKDDGLPLSAGLIYFYEDTARTVPKLVYQLTGAPENYTYTPLPNPMVLSSAGTTVDANGNYTPVYYYPYDDEGNLQLYYIAVYNSLGVQQFTLQGWPNITAEDEPGNSNTVVQNQISNSQFSQVSFNPEFGQVISWTGTLTAAEYEVAPDWVAIISATASGSITIQQVALAGSLDIITNPPYYLSILTAGGVVSSFKLRQRLKHNPDIFSSTTAEAGYLSGMMLISSLDGLSHNVSMSYETSAGGMAQTIVTGATGASGQQLIQNTILLDLGNNTDTADIGYVDIVVNLPTTGFITLTSIQIVGLKDDQTTVTYEQEPVNRQIDHLFHYYEPQLAYKPIPSYLVGWDFPLNPAQFGESGTLGSLGANTSAYVWDQTIVYQSTTNSVSYDRGAVNKGLELTATASTQMAVIQYVPANVANNILSQAACVNVRAQANADAAPLTFTVSLFWTDTTLPDLNANESIVDTLDSNGHVSSTNGTWTEITRNTGVFATASAVVSDGQYSFSGWDGSVGTSAQEDATWLAIVVGTATMAIDDVFSITSISLQSGEIPTIPAPQTPDEVLRECQYAYETSYASGTAIGTNTATNQIVAFQTIASSVLYFSFFQIVYRVIKYIAPTVTLYPSFNSGSAAASFAIYRGSSFATGGTNPIAQGIAANFTATQSGVNSITYVPTTTSAVITATGGQPYDEAVIMFQYVADARYGLIAF